MKSVHFQTGFDPEVAAAAIRSRRYGVIETSAGKLVAIHFRTFPKLLSWPEWWPVGSTYLASGQPDRFLLYYNQPRRFSNFLALSTWCRRPRLRTPRFGRPWWPSMAWLNKNSPTPCCAMPSTNGSPIGCSHDSAGNPIRPSAGIGTSSSGSTGRTP